MAQCTNCGTNNPDNTSFCIHCQHPLPSTRIMPHKRSAYKKLVTGNGQREGTRGFDRRQQEFNNVNVSAVSYTQAMQQNMPPKKLVSGESIYKGNRDFSEKFRSDFWSRHVGAVCAICHVALNQDNRQIDHKTAWSELRTALVEHTVCKDGVHWTVVLQDDVENVVTKKSNLQPLCDTCNGRKSGRKDTDDPIPRKANDVCPGVICPRSKAK